MNNTLITYRLRGSLHLMLDAPCPRNIQPEKWIASLASAHARVLRAHHGKCHAVTILPGGIHAVWTLPWTATPFGTSLAGLQSAFTDALPGSSTNIDAIDQRRRISLKAHRIRRRAELDKHVDDCHFAPVRYGWVNYPEQWPHSTLRRRAPSEMILT